MKTEKLKNWLRNNGAEILPVTNDYELLRFKGSEVGIIYKSGKHGNKYTTNAVNCFKSGRKWNGRPLNVGRKNSYKAQKKRLLIRDGNDCFFCCKPLGDDVTVEHLVSLVQGGKNTLGNMVLSHEECNNQAGNATVKQKIDIRISNLIKQDNGKN